MANQDCRINEDVSPLGLILLLSGNNPGSMRVLMECLNYDPFAFLFLLTSMDLKHLYDEHIWYVYEDVCGEDIERFIYHVQMELPNQITGEFGTSGPYASEVDLDEFSAKRVFGKPGSYWALEHPPTDPDYAYPIA